MFYRIAFGLGYGSKIVVLLALCGSKTARLCKNRYKNLLLLLCVALFVFVFSFLFCSLFILVLKPLFYCYRGSVYLLWLVVNILLFLLIFYYYALLNYIRLFYFVLMCLYFGSGCVVLAQSIVCFLPFCLP